MQREDAQNFDDIDIEVRIKLLLIYIERIQKGYDKDAKPLGNMDVNVTLKKAYAKLEKLMGIE